MSTLESLELTVGDFRIVWEVLYATDVSHRTYDQSGDSEFSHRTREQRLTHIIAPTHSLCRAMFDHKFPARVNYQKIDIWIINARLEAVQDELNLTYGSPNNRETKAGRVAHNRKNYLYGKRKRYERIIENGKRKRYERIIEKFIADMQAASPHSGEGSSDE
jgi:hypothetical protein